MELKDGYHIKLSTSKDKIICVELVCSQKIVKAIKAELSMPD